MSDLTEPLIEQGLVARTAVQGCSEDEIAALMRAQGVTELPRAYREFLAWGGRNPYWLSTSGEWDYDWLLGAKDVAREIVVDDHQQDFTPFAEAFVLQTFPGVSVLLFQSL
ncbi:hypothetical protein [Catenulispora pinisilvae]|uniref:hypothetical protein n=1 Tax=Catenulispora pinisilvae TaxID=2705253 RepID=UPI0018914D95|nr:hypothetical protein [Catenulispora pinisilvae]